MASRATTLALLVHNDVLRLTYLHIPRRHQTNLVTKLREFTRPIMGAGARLHADKARRQRLEELQHLAAPKLLPNDDLLGRV